MMRRYGSAVVPLSVSFGTPAALVARQAIAVAAPGCPRTPEVELVTLTHVRGAARPTLRVLASSKSDKDVQAPVNRWT